MKADKGPAAPASGFDEIPTFEELEADPEIAALLDFEPVPRKVKRPDGWTPELQRELIARIAATGTLQSAVWQMGKHATGAEALYKTPGAVSFRASWDRAVAIGRRRNGLDSQPPYLGDVPGITRRKSTTERPAASRSEGQLLNEYGDPEDEESYYRRAEEAKDHISNKMRNARRLFLRDIAPEPARRAAFEILTGFTIDWDKAERLQPQADEPWRKPRMRETDMLLTAEDGWMGEFLHGPDRKAELLAEINAWRAERGLSAVVWKGEGEDGGDLEDGEE